MTGPFPSLLSVQHPADNELMIICYKPEMFGSSLTVARRDAASVSFE